MKELALTIEIWAILLLFAAVMGLSGLFGLQ